MAFFFSCFHFDNLVQCSENADLSKMQKTPYGAVLAELFKKDRTPKLVFKHEALSSNFIAVWMYS